MRGNKLMTTLSIMKFGGTSVGSADALRAAALLVRAEHAKGTQVAVVVSAMSGVTNLLLDGADVASRGENGWQDLATTLQARHADTVAALLTTAAEQSLVNERIATHIGEFRALCHAVEVLGEASPRALDAISSLGERICMHLMAAHLRESGCAAEAVRAMDIIRTDATFQAARPDFEVTRELCRTRLLPLLRNRSVPVITGFIGATASGAITTLGRGGSDYSAAIIGSVLDADEVVIWTDVDGVMSTDPRIAPNARTLPTVTFREISELAFYGAKVLHPLAVRPMIEHGGTLWIRNTFNPAGPATRIVADSSAPSASEPLKAVTAIKDQSLVTIEGRGMLGVQGIAARAFGAVARTGTSVTLITQASSEQSICFTVPSPNSSRVVAALNTEFTGELVRKEIDRIWDRPSVVIVSVVGSGMSTVPGIPGRVFTALGNQQINILAIAQGSSECSISLIVSTERSDDSVRAIHALIVA